MKNKMNTMLKALLLSAMFILNPSGSSVQAMDNIHIPEGMALVPSAFGEGACLTSLSLCDMRDENGIRIVDRISALPQTAESIRERTDELTPLLLTIHRNAQLEAVGGDWRSERDRTYTGHGSPFFTTDPRVHPEQF